MAGQARILHRRQLLGLPVYGVVGPDARHQSLVICAAETKSLTRLRRAFSNAGQDKFALDTPCSIRRVTAVSALMPGAADMSRLRYPLASPLCGNRAGPQPGPVGPTKRRSRPSPVAAANEDCPKDADAELRWGAPARLAAFKSEKLASMVPSGEPGG